MENSIQNDVAALNRIDAVKMILKTMSEITDLPFSIVARVTEDSWTACAIHDMINFGLSPGDELELKTTYCNTVRESNAPVFVRHASTDPLYKDHPALSTYMVESYIGVPLFRKNGEYFGVLCSLDTKPNKLSEHHIQTFTLMAKLIAHELEAEELQRELNEALKLANQTSEVRARFMGILGHDLRNPLNTIVMAAHLQKTGNLDSAKNTAMADKILRTSQRMQFLIEDLLDASQTAQGNNILIQKTPGSLRDICGPLIEDFRMVNPTRQIDFISDEPCYGDWDEGRLGQVLSNLLTNALGFGSNNLPVTVTLKELGEQIELKVNNRGEVMSDEVEKNLFTAFWRGAKRLAASSNSSGLGLGLYLAKQIVEAHGGTIGVESNETHGTTFTVILPRDA